MHLGSIAQWISRSPDYKCFALRFGFWGTHGISSGRRITVFGLPSNTEHHRTNARLITWQKTNIIFVSLSCGGFSSRFSSFFTVSIIMIRLRYIIESCQSFQTVLFSDLRNISLQILGRVWNEGSRMLCQRLPSPSSTTTSYKAFGLAKSPLFGAACIDQASSYLEGAEQAPLRAFTKQWSPAMGNIITQQDLTRQ